MNNNSQLGVSLYLALILMTIVLAIALGLTTILIGQMKTIAKMGDSVKAFSAADTGIEMALYNPASSQSGSVDEATFTVTIKCGRDYLECPEGYETDQNCSGNYFCIKSVGTYKETKRAIEIIQ